MSLKSTIKAIEKSGFGYIKVELEAQLNRGAGDDYDDDYDTCSDCDGDGYATCDDCSGNGYLTLDSSTAGDTCLSCMGSGNQTCSDCDGDGEISHNSESGDYSDEGVCQQFILDSLSTEAKKAIVYGEFYNDGSVDSEYTFTIKTSDAIYLPEFIESFTKLAKAVDNGMDIDGAGMHIAVIPAESNGIYPVRTTIQFDNEKIGNFTNEVTKLLPALFLAATSGNFTRGLNYRIPKICDDKYSAIHVIRNNTLEYRLFETCYQRPDTIFDYLETIARTLEYFDDPSKKVPVQGKEYVFYDREGIKGFTSTPDQVGIIKKQLKMVIGKGITLKSFQESRELDLSVSKLRKDFNKKLTRTKVLYKEAVKSYESRISQPLTDYEVETLEHYSNRDYFNSETTEEDKIAYLRGISKVGTESSFLERNILNMRLSTKISV